MIWPGKTIKDGKIKRAQRILNCCAIMRNMLRVGLTGNIGTGKSKAAEVFAELGAFVIDADVIARELLCPGQQAFNRVVQAFGERILNPDNTVDRRRLASIVFSDIEKLKLLNSLVHPEVGKAILGRIAELEQRSLRGIVIVDAALTIETGHQELYDCLIVVTCDPDIQLKRIIDRGGLTAEEAKLRMESQMPTSEKLKFADHIIDTSGALTQTRVQIEAIYRRLLLQEANKQNPALRF